MGRTENSNKKAGMGGCGVQFGNSPNLWPENNPSPYKDADMPGEKFVPMPNMDSGEDSNVKRILKYIAFGLLIALVIAIFISICLESPQLPFRGETGRGHFFG